MESMFGDMRLDKRLATLTDQLSAVPVANLPQALREKAQLKAGYRFMNNEQVTHAGIIATERPATEARIRAAGGEIVLAVQDTTSYNFANRTSLEGLGVLENNKTAGFFAHTTLAVSEVGIPLGIWDQQVWTRAANHGRDKAAHKAKPITEKESYQWLQGLPEAPQVNQRIVTVGDREADVYELFQEAHNRGMDFIVRAVRNRRLEAAPTLHKQLATLKPQTRYTLTVRPQVNRAEREAQVELRFTTVTLIPPNRPAAALAIMPLEPLTVQVVEVREINAPDNVKTPLHWLLLTTRSVESVADAHQIVQFYTYRWLVERFHFVLKSGGCDFEKSQLRTVDALYRLLGLCSRVAWRILWLTYQARQTPDAPSTVALTQAETQALVAFTQPSSSPLPPVPTLYEVTRAIAKLGGFIGRNSDGEPGVKTLWRGWQRLQDITSAWLLFHPQKNVGNL